MRTGLPVLIEPRLRDCWQPGSAFDLILPTDSSLGLGYRKANSPPTRAQRAM